MGLWFEFRFEWTYVSHITSFLLYIAVPGGSTVKNLPTMWKNWVRCLGWEDSLEEGMATHSTTVAWRIPWTEEPGGLQSVGLKRVGHD